MWERDGRGAGRSIRVIIIINLQFKPFRMPFRENRYKGDNCARWG